MAEDPAPVGIQVEVTMLIEHALNDVGGGSGKPASPGAIFTARPLPG